MSHERNELRRLRLRLRLQIEWRLRSRVPPQNKPHQARTARLHAREPREPRPAQPYCSIMSVGRAYLYLYAIAKEGGGRESARVPRTR